MFNQQMLFIYLNLNIFHDWLFALAKRNRWINHIEDGLETIPFQINSEEDFVKWSSQNRVEN